MYPINAASKVLKLWFSMHRGGASMEFVDSEASTMGSFRIVKGWRSLSRGFLGTMIIRQRI